MSTLIKSFYFAFQGLGYLVRTQRNARIQITIAILVTALGVWLGLPLDHWAILVLSMALVITAEAANTVIEVLLDWIQPEYHPKAKVVKDVAAGAVLLSASLSVIVGLLILGPPLWAHMPGN